MKVGDNIFVYGTLRRGKGADGYLKGRTNPIGITNISGVMYHLGGFPGVKVLGKGDYVKGVGTVEGELHEITDETLPEILDRYEGYPHLYGRREVETECGRRTWVYEINSPQPAERIIPSGKWE